LKTPFVSSPQAAHVGSLLYLLRAHCSQKMWPHFVATGDLYSSSLTAKTLSFPGCDYCFRRGYVWPQGRPCGRCKKAKTVCINVTEVSLRKTPNCAKHILYVASEAVPCDRPCRICFCNGVICRKVKPDGPCDYCLRVKRKSRSDLENIRGGGMYARNSTRSNFQQY
jgi:hypothetical protein